MMRGIDAWDSNREAALDPPSVDRFQKDVAKALSDAAGVLVNS